jgi:tRNA modification GTPase
MAIFLHDDTIAAIATAPGTGAIAVLRLSGSDAFSIADSIFESPNKQKTLTNEKANTLHFGRISEGQEIIDEVVVSLFKKPYSYTGEDVVEISCHGSSYIQQRILQLLLKKGARLAEAGEFTRRAFLNGKMDLSQAEAVADLIASGSEAARKIAMHQMRGGFKNEINDLRTQLLQFVSLIELELDFAEEDVEFANRSELKSLIEHIYSVIGALKNSFQLGNVIKNGIPVAIAGEPNVGKSTLLNLLLKEDKAIVSEIAGTTRDIIEDVISLGGIHFRFIDTAGLRHTTDTIESMGIERAYSKIKEAAIILLLIDATDTTAHIRQQLNDIRQRKNDDSKLIVVLNKADKLTLTTNFSNIELMPAKEHLVVMSAKTGEHLDLLESELLKAANYSQINDESVIISNIRHFEALSKSAEAIARVLAGLKNGISSDFLSQDIREVLHYLGEISGEITNDEILGNIFKNFCIGK